MKNPWVLIGVIAVVLIGGSIGYAQYVGTISNEGVEVQTQVAGNPDAEVTLVEYSDFECPACGQFYPYVKDVLADYGDQIRFEYKHFPLTQAHPNAEPAARAAEAAGQQRKFFEFHDLLFENQQEWSGQANASQYFTTYAEQLELDMGQWKTQQRASLLRDKVADDFAEGRSLGVTGTPTFFLNGERMNIQTFNDFRTQIEAAIGVDPATSTDSTDADDSAAETSATTSSTEADASVEFGI